MRLFGRPGRGRTRLGRFGRSQGFLPRVARLTGVLALCASTGVVLLLGSPSWLSLVVVGTFMLAAPGVLLIDVLRVRDGLLGLVLAMVAGPVLWAVLATAEVFAARWAPRDTVLVVAGLLALVAAALLVAVVRGDSAVGVSRHRFRSHQLGRVDAADAGRHRGAFPSPGRPVENGAERHLR